MISVLITKILLALAFIVVSVFGGCWIMTICAAIAYEKWDRWAEGLLFGCFVDILIFFDNLRYGYDILDDCNENDIDNELREVIL